MRISDWSSDVCSSDLGTFVSRALMGAVMGWCDREPRIRSIVAQLPRVNVYARDYLERSGFRYCDDESAPGLVRMRRDRKSTRLTPVTNAHLVCRLLLEKKKKNIIPTHLLILQTRSTYN